MRGSSVTAAIVPGPGWDRVLDRLAGDTAMIVGAIDRGKSHLTRWLAQQATAPAAVVSADVGQPLLGVPACAALALRTPWRRPDALWFVGDTTPVRHLLPMVIGTARLADRARTRGAELVAIDTGGLVDGPLGRLLKYHKALAAGVTDVVAIQEERELEPLLGVLEGIARVHRLAPSPAARARGRDERRQYRERLFRAHLRGATVVRFEARRVIGPGWSPGIAGAPLPGTLVGLLDGEGFCLGLGSFAAVRGRMVEVHARRQPPRAVAWLRLGTLRIGPGGVELRGSS
jgi:polynucleotide 5'-hydroxyl-kinase GRC3/NOL9